MFWFPKSIDFSSRNLTLKSPLDWRVKTTQDVSSWKSFQRDLVLYFYISLSFLLVQVLFSSFLKEKKLSFCAELASVLIPLLRLIWLNKSFVWNVSKSCQVCFCDERRSGLFWLFVEVHFWMLAYENQRSIFWRFVSKSITVFCQSTSAELERMVKKIDLEGSFHSSEFLLVLQSSDLLWYQWSFRVRKIKGLLGEWNMQIKKS